MVRAPRFKKDTQDNGWRVTHRTPNTYSGFTVYAQVQIPGYTNTLRKKKQ